MNRLAHDSKAILHNWLFPSWSTLDAPSPVFTAAGGLRLGFRPLCRLHSFYCFDPWGSCVDLQRWQQQLTLVVTVLSACKRLVLNTIVQQRQLFLVSC